VCGLILFVAVPCFFWHLGIGDGDSGDTALVRKAASVLLLTLSREVKVRGA
jgi:hypothetical protein